MTGTVAKAVASFDDVSHSTRRTVLPNDATYASAAHSRESDMLAPVILLANLPSMFGAGCAVFLA